MKRSEEIEALANRWASRASSMLWPEQEQMKRDMGLTVNYLHQLAANVRAIENAAEHGNGAEPRLRTAG